MGINETLRGDAVERWALGEEPEDVDSDVDEAHDGPPAHWLTMVRRHAPGLYARLRDEGQVFAQRAASPRGQAVGDVGRFVARDDDGAELGRALESARGFAG